jgi:hypothetical protein
MISERTQYLNIGRNIIEGTILFFVQLQYPTRENQDGGSKTIIKDPKLPKSGAGVAPIRSTFEGREDLTCYLMCGMIEYEVT